MEFSEKMLMILRTYGKHFLVLRIKLFVNKPSFQTKMTESDHCN